MRCSQKTKKSVFVKQHDEKDCGPACLCSLCRYYGSRISIAHARELSQTDIQGTNAVGLVEAAKRLGFQSSVLKGTTEDLLSSVEAGQISLPFIAHIVTPTNMEHYVVVYSMDEKAVLVSDPAIGKRIFSLDEFFTQWTGVVITFLLLGKVNAPHRDSPFKVLASLILSQKKAFSLVVICSFVVTVVGVAGAFVFQFIIDKIVSRAEFESLSSLIVPLTQVCLAVAILFALQAAVQMVRGRLLSSLANRLDMKVMLDFYNHLVDLPMSFFGMRKTGEIISRFSDASKIREAASSVALTAIIDGTMVIAGSILLWVMSWRLSCIAISLFVIFILIVSVYRRRLEKNNRALMEDGSQLTSYLKETVDGIETIKAYCNENSVKEATKNKFLKLLSDTFSQSVLINNQGSIISLATSLSTLAVLWLGTQEVLSGEMTLGSLIAFNSLVGYFLEPLKNIIGLQPTVQAAFVALDRLNDINEIPEEPIAISAPSADFSHGIELRDVNFRYGTRDLVLKDINLVIKPGEKIAIVGESGSGKTTLARILMGFYSPEKGDVLIGKNPLSELDIREYRSKVSYLSQDAYLFADTIEANIRFGNQSASNAIFDKVCDDCEVSSFVTSLPLEYNTQIEELGTNLSGGQKQRVALARALIKKPRLLILDEATSNLDVITEQTIANSIGCLANGIMVVTIAHRLSTILNSDKIVLMDRGRICEIGSHDELVRRKGKYYNFWIRQTSGA